MSLEKSLPSHPRHHPCSIHMLFLCCIFFSALVTIWNYLVIKFIYLFNDRMLFMNCYWTYKWVNYLEFWEHDRSVKWHRRKVSCIQHIFENFKNFLIMKRGIWNKCVQNGFPNVQGSISKTVMDQISTRVSLLVWHTALHSDLPLPVFLINNLDEYTRGLLNKNANDRKQL